MSPRRSRRSPSSSVLFGSAVGLGAALSGPAASWAQKMPEGLPRLQERLTFLSKPIQTLQKFLHQAEDLAQGAGPAVATVAVQGGGLNDRVLNATRTIASGLFTTVLVLFFLLVSGDIFLRRLVEILPRFKDKRQAVHISQQIEADISAYLATITVMNLGVGVATGIVTAACGVGDPVLWGTVAFLLNYVPILGPLIGVTILVFVGLLSIETLWLAFVPAGVYVLVHVSRRGDNHPDAARQALHDQSGAGHPVAGVLVLDVGHSWCDPRCAYAGCYQDRLRPYRASRIFWPFYRRVM